MKKSFITGLALLLPFVLTLMIFLFLLNFLTKPFVGLVEQFLTNYGLFDKQNILINKQLILFLCRLLILAALLAITLLIGLLTRIFIFHAILKMGGQLFNKIPLVNKVYRAAHEVISTVFHSSAPTFSQVVLAPFPSLQCQSIGLITFDPLTDQPIEDAYGNVSVFIPATPNPTMGFMILYRREQLCFLDMKVDEAIRFVVSCGVMCPTFNVQKPRPLDNGTALLAGE